MQKDVVYTKTDYSYCILHLLHKHTPLWQKLHHLPFHQYHPSCCHHLIKFPMKKIYTVSLDIRYYIVYYSLFSIIKMIKYL